MTPLKCRIRRTVAYTMIEGGRGFSDTGSKYTPCQYVAMVDDLEGAFCDEEVALAVGRGELFPYGNLILGIRPAREFPRKAALRLFELGAWDQASDIEDAMNAKGPLEPPYSANSVVRPAWHALAPGVTVNLEFCVLRTDRTNDFELYGRLWALATLACGGDPHDETAMLAAARDHLRFALAFEEELGNLVDQDLELPDFSVETGGRASGRPELRLIR